MLTQVYDTCRNIGNKQTDETLKKQDKSIQTDIRDELSILRAPNPHKRLRHIPETNALWLEPILGAMLVQVCVYMYVYKRYS